MPLKIPEGADVIVDGRGGSPAPIEPVTPAPQSASTPVVVPQAAPKAAAAAPAKHSSVEAFKMGGAPGRAPGPAAGDEIGGVFPPNPTNWTEALFNGAMFAGPLGRLVPYVAKLPMPLMRIILGAVGSGTGSAIEGKGFVEGAKSGAMAGAVGEAIGAAGPAAVKGALGLAGGAARHIPGLREGMEGALGPTVKQATKAEAATATAGTRADAAAHRQAVAAHTDTVRGQAAGFRAQEQQFRDQTAERKTTIAERQKLEDKTLAEEHKVAWGQYRRAVDAYHQQLESQVAAQTAQSTGQMLGQAVPPLAGRETATALDALKAKGTKALVGEYFGNRVAEAQSIIGGPEQTIRVKALARVPPASKIEAGDEEATAALRDVLIGPGGQKITLEKLLSNPRRQPGDVPVEMEMQAEAAKAAKEGRMTLTEAADRLAALRLRGFLANDPAMRTVAGKRERIILGEAKRQIQEELNSFDPRAWEAFADGRRAYAVGSAMIDLLRRDGIFKRDAGKVELNPRVLQGMIAKHRGWLEERMGPEDFSALLKATRLDAGRIGQADVASTAGSPPAFVGLQVPAGQGPKPPLVRPRMDMSEGVATPTRPSRPTYPARPTAPAPRVPPPVTDTKYPVDLSRIMIDSAVQRAIQ